MRSYLMDEIAPADVGKIAEYLVRNGTRSELGNIFWIGMPLTLLSPIQLQHVQCRPLVFAAEIGPTWVKIEFFLRSLVRMQCECQGYCTEPQAQYILHWAQQMMELLSVST